MGKKHTVVGNEIKMEEREVSRGGHGAFEVPRDGKYVSHEVDANKMNNKEERDI